MATPLSRLPPVLRSAGVHRRQSYLRLLQQHRAASNEAAELKKLQRVKEAEKAFEKEERQRYQSTLNLPETDLPPRFGASTREPNFTDRTTTQLYKWQTEVRPNAPTFQVHDGPPYANGSLHLGHLLNKTLKDMMNRYRILCGKRVIYTPGWDCHGLPIELKALDKFRMNERRNKVKNSSHRSSDHLVTLTNKHTSSLPEPMAVRKLARRFAQLAITNQKQGFERYGVMADWDWQPEVDTLESTSDAAVATQASTTNSSSKAWYSTMDPKYEARQLEVFGDLVESGVVWRGRKPVHWSPSSQTALAEAELEYFDDHQSPAAFVQFPMVDVQQFKKATGWADWLDDTRPPSFVAWTTTPWTLPANVALAIDPKSHYSIVRCTFEEVNKSLGIAGDYWVVATESVAPMQDLMSSRPIAPRFQRVGRSFLGKHLLGLEYHHPLEVITPERREALDSKSEFLFRDESEEPVGSSGSNSYSTKSRVRKVIVGPHVSGSEGTGVVHTAPTHGAEDYEAWKNAGRSLTDLPCVVDECGRFSVSDVDTEVPAGIMESGVWDQIEGLDAIVQGSSKILEILAEPNLLVFEHRYEHRYPYDWRTKRPVIVRLTEQWFVNVAQLQESAREALVQVDVKPPAARQRLEAMLDGRSEWCISRQRAWGVPIPAFFDENGRAIMTRESVRHVAKVFEQHPQGSDAWWLLPIEELLPTNLLATHKSGKRVLTKGTDTLDVWFDSGCSWNKVLRGDDDQGLVAENDDDTFGGFPEPADVYLEGSDQHRGWFQSSLLTSVGARQQPISPFKQLVTHGFVLDADGRKMSKSVGNVISPGEYINGSRTKYGVDVVRLWVAASGYTGDVVVGPTQMKQASEDLIKLRGTLRYLLGVVSDFKPDEHTHEAFASRSDVNLDIEAGIQLVDRLTLSRLQRFHFRLSKGYEAHNFRAVYSEMMRFVTSDVSAIFITSTKDRLRCEPKNSKSRRAAQAVAWKVLQSLTLGMAPIAPHMAEDVFEFASKEVGQFDAMFPGESREPTWKREVVKKTKDAQKGDVDAVGMEVIKEEEEMEEEKASDGGAFSVFQSRWFDIKNLPPEWELSLREKNLCLDLMIIREQLHHAIAGARAIRSQERAIVTLFFEGRETKIFEEARRLSQAPEGGLPFMAPLALLFGVPEVRVEFNLVPEQGNDVLKFKSMYSNGERIRMVVDLKPMEDEHKCKRCWMHVQEQHMRGDVCARCNSIK